MIDKQLRGRILRTTAHVLDPNFPNEHPATTDARLATHKVSLARTELREAQIKLERLEKELAARLLRMQKAGQEEGWATWWRNALN